MIMLLNIHISQYLPTARGAEEAQSAHGGDLQVIPGFVQSWQQTSWLGV